MGWLLNKGVAGLLTLHSGATGGETPCERVYTQQKLAPT